MFTDRKGKAEKWTLIPGFEGENYVDINDLLASGPIITWKKMKMNRTKIMVCCETQVVCFVLFQTIFEKVFLALLLKYGSPTSYPMCRYVVLRV